MNIRYFEGDVEVKLGDHVETRFWILFARFVRHGRVIYLPGVSALNREFEHHGLRWVAIHCEEDGAVIGEVIDPKTGNLLKRVKFIKRDESPVPTEKLPIDTGPAEDE